MQIFGANSPSLTKRTALRQIRWKRRLMGLKEFTWNEVILFVNHMISLLMWNNWHWFLWTYTIKDSRFLFKKDLHCNWTSFINASNSSELLVLGFLQKLCTNNHIKKICKLHFIKTYKKIYKLILVFRSKKSPHDCCHTKPEESFCSQPH